MTQTFIRHILTIGLNDKDTHIQKFDTITAYKLIEDIIKEYNKGYTMYETKGGYMHEDNIHYVQETSIRVEMLFISELEVRIIADRIKASLNQESIAYETQTTNSQLI